MHYDLPGQDIYSGDSNNSIQIKWNGRAVSMSECGPEDVGSNPNLRTDVIFFLNVFLIRFNLI